jgi:hypothetical protein
MVFLGSCIRQMLDKCSTTELHPQLLGSCIRKTEEKVYV